MGEKAGFIRHRYVMCGMIFLGIFLVYAMRVNLSVSIIAMVRPINHGSGNETTEGTCPIPTNHTRNNASMHGDLDWNSEQQSYVLLAFFFGYITTQIPGGILAESLSTKLVFGMGIFLTAVLTLFTEVVAKWSIYAFIILRVLEGMTEGVTYPALYSLISRWAPRQERSTMLNLSVIGSSVGTIVTLPLAAALCQSDWGWPAAFYVPAMFGIAWSIVWYFIASCTPESHKWISEEERLYIVENRGVQTNATKRKIPWGKILTSSKVWALCATRFANTLVFYVFLTEMPTFLDNIFHINLSDNGYLNGLFYVCHTLSTAFNAIVADQLVHRFHIRVNVVRKTYEATGAILASCILLAIVALGCQYKPISILMCLALVSVGTSGGGNSVVPIDMAPEISGSIMGVVNMMGNCAGIVAPFIVGQLTATHNTLAQWHIVFYITVALNLIGALVFVIFGTSEEQHWARRKDDEEDIIT